MLKSRRLSLLNHTILILLIGTQLKLALLVVMAGALCSSCMFLEVNNASTEQPIVSIERTLFYREKAAMYSPLSNGEEVEGFGINSHIHEMCTVYGPSMIGVSVAVLVGFCLFFFIIFAVSIEVLNFKKR
ncbi:hypothetical protein NC653_022780 [Populus alba x Populus x berolinensis]|uniref:Uncharacterized protein n=1 Tax=Populus alba x Populus x berolinensis TaxID=444605 RepID=A0AAD6MFW4_9ROSI|nr:hypothetical protein NC653_022780 [Populus alba x Populus x berolinensis]